MATIYDVFAKVIEKAPCSQAELGFRSPVYSQLSRLQQMKFVKKAASGYVPLKNTKSEAAFKVIKYCMKSGLNYNIFLQDDMLIVLDSIKGHDIRPQRLRNNQQRLEVLKYLEKHQFILVRKRRPARGTLLGHSIYHDLSGFFGKKIEVKEVYSRDTAGKVLGFPEHEANPFEESYFSFLAGNAQLEGSTVTEGETVELLTKEIYPDKAAKDIQMVKNLDEAMRYVMDNIEAELTTAHIKKLNEKVMFSLHRGAGQYKKTRNRIAGNPDFRTTPPRLVPAEMERFCTQFNMVSSRKQCLERIGAIHNDLQRVHPFPDGNSRTTRLVVNWLLAKWRFPILVLRAGSFDRYMALTKLSGVRSDEELRTLMLHILLHESLN